MKEMIKRIVEMDKSARELTGDAQKEKMNAERDIAERCEELRRDYLEHARRRISINEPEERAAAEADWREKKRRFTELEKNMFELYVSDADKWVDGIVARVLEGTV